MGMKPSGDSSQETYCIFRITVRWGRDDVFGTRNEGAPTRRKREEIGCKEEKEVCVEGEFVPVGSLANKE